MEIVRDASVRTSTVALASLSLTVAVFVIGLIAVRRRKYEIILMRTAGESKAKIYFGFILEQMICIILGITPRVASLRMGS